MDNNTIANLQEYETLINLSYEQIDKSLKKYSEIDQSQQRFLKNRINHEISSVNAFIDLMKMESAILKEDINIDKWQEIIRNLRSKRDEYKKQLNQMLIKDTNEMNDFMGQNGISEYLCIDRAPIDYPVNRPRHKKKMFKRCISDKLFLGMICIILLYTIVIVILYLFS